MHVHCIKRSFPSQDAINRLPSLKINLGSRIRAAETEKHRSRHHHHHHKKKKKKRRRHSNDVDGEDDGEDSAEDEEGGDDDHDPDFAA